MTFVSELDSSTADHLEDERATCRHIGEVDAARITNASASARFVR
jgi:hypothetical protein